MDEPVRRRKGLEDDVRRAIDDEAFTLLYQPQLRLSDGQVYGAEALVRWNHPNRGLVSPADFIPLAESTGLIRKLGHWVLSTASIHVRAWVDAGHGDLRIAVNLSAVEFMSNDLLDNVRSAWPKVAFNPRNWVWKSPKAPLWKTWKNYRHNAGSARDRSPSGHG